MRIEDLATKNHLERRGRFYNQLRNTSIEPHYVRHPAGSAMIRCGDTWVLCTTSVEERVPPFLVGQNQGWVTAEYSMLPGSGTQRSSRTPNGRSKEIERLIGRSLRAAIDLTALGQRTFTVDCDVIQADGGTRTAAVTGGFVSLVLAIQQYVDKKRIVKNPILQRVAAISVGMVGGKALLDLDYSEDSRADVDMNIVMAQTSEKMSFIEVQGTAEKRAFDKEQLITLSDLAEHGILQLFEIQKKALASVTLLKTI